MTFWVSRVTVFPVGWKKLLYPIGPRRHLRVEIQEHVYSLKFVPMFMEEIISPKQGIIKSLICALNTLCEEVIEIMGCNSSQPNFTISFPMWIPNWKMYHLPYLDGYCKLLDSVFLPQQLYIVHFHTVSSSSAWSVHESKLQKLAILLPNSKTFRSVSGIFLSS